MHYPPPSPFHLTPLRLAVFVFMISSLTLLFWKGVGAIIGFIF